MQIAIILLLEIALFAYAMRREFEGLMCFIILNLVAVTLTSAVEVNYVFGVSNVGNLFYAFAINALAVVYFSYGVEAVKDAVKLALFTSVGLFCLRYSAVMLNTANQQMKFASPTRKF